MGVCEWLVVVDGRRVAGSGIDGVRCSRLAEHSERFPNLTALGEAGAGGAIDSSVPPEASAGWPARTTGVNPGETGVYGFQDRENGSYETYVPMGRDVQATRLWDRVTDADRKATVMNVPVTFPPQRNVQRMVSGFLSPSVEKASHPEELTQTLDDSDYIIDVNAKLGHKDDKGEFVDHAHKTMDRRFDAFEQYLSADDWDLFFGVFMTTDRINHFLFKDYEHDGENREAFFEFYEQLDDYLGQIREMLPDDVTLVVASDHGFTSLDYEVHCNTWLEEQGLLSYEDDDHSELGDIAEFAVVVILVGQQALLLKPRVAVYLIIEAGKAVI